MKHSYLPLLLVFFLIVSPGNDEAAADQPCRTSPIHLPNCSHEACVQSCVETYGESVNGGCIDNQTCCCNIGQTKPNT
ncbi:Uncharacterized protein TCM_036859 [Theobroma cacao]|uniref:Uncharacterized protein n=1 Tax=Theobroma cacao TaxID=3641 RepID=A0A061GIB4_THECC|nr:Uncharacterized protein TCM_036859 [Theobroma cacao]